MNMDQQGSKRLVWLDLEMTGLDPASCTIIEIATIVTTNELEVVSEGPTLAIHQPDDVLQAMDEWNTAHHGESGLIDRVRASSITMAEAERETLNFVARYVDANKSPLCGNSIAQDRRFLRRYMPELESFLHYRNIDVSTIKELVHRWYPPEYRAPQKKQTHLAMDDIRESIAELKFYRETIFIEPYTEVL